MSTRTGRCMCGAVQFEAEVPGVYNACWCKMCQQWASGLFMGVQTQGFKLTAGEAEFKTFKSSEWAERGFCSKCGSNIYYKADAQDHPNVALGTLDDTSGLERVFEFYTDLKPKGFEPTDKTHAMTGDEVVAFFTGGDT